MTRGVSDAFAAAPCCILCGTIDASIDASHWCDVCGVPLCARCCASWRRFRAPLPRPLRPCFSAGDSRNRTRMLLNIRSEKSYAS